MELACGAGSTGYMEVRLARMKGGSSSPHRRKGRLEGRPFFVLNHEVIQLGYFSRYFSLSGLFSHSAASGGAGFFSVSTGQF